MARDAQAAIIAAFFTLSLNTAEATPTLEASGYLGGEREDQINDVFIDAAGDIYLVGETRSPDFLTSATAYQAQYDGFFLDAFVTKLSADGAAVIYSTYLGGTDFDVATGIVVDAQGEAIIVGYTASADFPTTPGAAQEVFGGKGESALLGEYGDAFIARLSADGATLRAATFLGGQGVDRALDVALDEAGRVIVVGHTDSPEFPTVAPLQGALAGAEDAFLSVLEPDLSRLTMSTLIGGDGADRAYGLATHPGALHIVGETRSSDFPVLDPLQDTLQGSRDGFWVALDGDYQPRRASYLGGGGADLLRAARVGPSGQIILAGEGDSERLPGTRGAWRFKPAGLQDVFITALPYLGSDQPRSTYLGSSQNDALGGLEIDAAGRIFVVGTTSGADFPQTSAEAPPLSGPGGLNDGFIAALEADLAGLIYASRLGGERGERVNGLALGAGGETLLLGGQTHSEGLVTGDDAAQPTIRVAPDGFFWRLNVPPVGAAVVERLSPSQGGRGEVTIRLRGPALGAVTAVILAQGEARYEAIRRLSARDGDALECLFLLHDAPLGAYDVITRRGEAEARLEGGFTVIEAEAAPLTLNIIAPRRARLGTPTLLTVTVSNPGALDALGSLLIIDFPPDAIVTPAFDWAKLGLDQALGARWASLDHFARAEGQLALPLHLPRIGAGDRQEVAFWITHQALGDTDTYARVWSFPAAFFTPLEQLREKAGSGVSAQILDCKRSILEAEGAAYSVGLPAHCLWASARDEVMLDRHMARHGFATSPVSAYELGLSIARDCGAEAAGVADLFGADTVMRAVNQAIEVCALQEQNEAANDGGGDGRGSEDQLVRFIQRVLRAIDPNELVGLEGLGPNHALRRGGALTFEVRFENLASAGLPAQVVHIEDHLDPAYFDLESLSVEAIRVGAHEHAFGLAPPQGPLDLPLPEALALGLETRVADDGRVTWTLTTLDRATQAPTTQALDGFLPPNQAPPEGQGAIRYQIKLRDDAPADTLIPNAATITFDDNPPIETNAWPHVIDEAPPRTTVAPLADPVDDQPIEITWSADDGLGAGAARYEVRLGLDDAPLSHAASTTAPRATLSIAGARRVAVQVLATDGLGNVEIKAAADLTLEIGAGGPDDGPDDGPDGGPDGDAGRASGDGCGCRGLGGAANLQGGALAWLWALSIGLVLAYRRRPQRARRRGGA
ncbi:hypothetical protein KKB55_03045 [Myxococcota bacterium]|nr:hypothetical protein [Myxococcota bacterium]MBU1896729.1 hypothetical protein [Myxococcota bacterium]